jgi:hypothetical protein
VRILHLPPLRERDTVAERIARKPVVLTRIPWGKPDAATAAAVCQHIVDATPPTLIPANPVTGAKLRQVLRSFHIH